MKISVPGNKRVSPIRVIFPTRKNKNQSRLHFACMTGKSDESFHHLNIKLNVIAHGSFGVFDSAMTWHLNDCVAKKSRKRKQSANVNQSVHDAIAVDAVIGDLLPAIAGAQQLQMQTEPDQAAPFQAVPVQVVPTQAAPAPAAPV